MEMAHCRIPDPDDAGKIRLKREKKTTNRYQAILHKDLEHQTETSGDVGDAHEPGTSQQLVGTKVINVEFKTREQIETEFGIIESQTGTHAVAESWKVKSQIGTHAEEECIKVKSQSGTQAGIDSSKVKSQSSAQVGVDSWKIWSQSGALTDRILSGGGNIPTFISQTRTVGEIPSVAEMDTQKERDKVVKTKSDIQIKADSDKRLSTPGRKPWSRPMTSKKRQEETCNRQNAIEALHRRLKTLTSLKTILSDPSQGDVVLKKPKVDKYIEIIQRLLRERRVVKRPQWVPRKKKLVPVVEDDVEEEPELTEETPEEVPAEEIEAKEEEVVEEEKEEAKKEFKKAKGKKGKKEKSDKKKGKGNKGLKIDKGGKKKVKDKGKSKKQKKEKAKSSKDKKKEKDEEMGYMPPPERLRRAVVPSEDVLEPFGVDLRAPPPTPRAADPAMEIKPDIVVFKDFTGGHRYSRSVHVRNVGARSVKCRLLRVEQIHEDTNIQVTGLDSMVSILTGLSLTLRVIFSPTQDTEGTGALIVMRTRRPDSPERELMVRVRCEPCQPEPIVHPTELTFPHGSQHERIYIENKGGRDCILNIENLPLREQDKGDLLEEVMENVFREFQFEKRYHIKIPACQKVSLHVKFTPGEEEGPREEKFLFRFIDYPPQEVTIRAIKTPNPLIVAPLELDLGQCLSDNHVLQQNFLVTNTGKFPIRVTVESGPLTVIPSQALIQSGYTLPFCVRLVTSLEGDLEFPVTVFNDQGHSIQITVFAHSCPRQTISIIPEFLDLGKVTCAETVSCPIQLRNNTIAMHKFGFLRLPPGVSIQPGDGFGTILPEEVLTLYFLYSPSSPAALVHFHIRCYTKSGSFAICKFYAEIIPPQCHASLSSIVFLPTPCGSYSIIRMKLRGLVEKTSFEFKSSTDKILITPRTGELTGSVSVFVVFRPLDEEPLERAMITCITEAAWLQIPVKCSITPPEFVLEEDSPRVDFSPVVIGAHRTSCLHFYNINTNTLFLSASLLHPIGPFFSSWSPTRLDPDHILAVPITFRPTSEALSKEYLEMRGGNTILPLVVSGQGVGLKIEFHPDTKVFRLQGSSGSINVEISNLCIAPLPMCTLFVFAREGPAQEKVKENKGKKEKTGQRKGKAEKKDKEKKGGGGNKKGAKGGKGKNAAKEKMENTEKMGGKQSKEEDEKVLEAELEKLELAEASAFTVEPARIIIAPNQSGVFKFTFNARADNTLHVARFNFLLDGSLLLREVTFLGTSGVLKKDKTSDKIGKKPKSKEKKRKGKGTSKK